MHATPFGTRRTLAGSIQDFGVLMEDGALDVVRLRARSRESYSVEVDSGERFRFSIVSSAPVTIHVSENRRRARFAPVDQFSITLRPRVKASFVISLGNAGTRPVDVAVFLRTVPEAEHAGHQAA